MKSALRHTAILLLTISVMLGSVGVAFSKQICQMALEKVSKPEEMEGCCEKSASGADEDDCCELEISYEKLEPVSSLKAFNLEIPVFFPDYIKQLVAQHILYFAADKRILTYTDSSPPLSGRALLHKIQVLVV